MKIVYLTTSTLPSKSANSVHVMKMCDAFAKMGHKVKIVAAKNTLRKKYDYGYVFNYYGLKEKIEIKHIYRPKIKYGEYIYALGIFMHLLMHKADFIFSRFLLGSYFTVLINVPHIFETHAPIKHGSRFQKPIFGKFILKKNLKFLVVITQPLKEIFINQFPNTADKIVVAPDGADVPRISKTKERNKRLQVGYVGHLQKGRGVELIISLAENCSWADFHIVGGHNDDIERLKTISSNLINLKIHGFVPPSETEKIRLSMDVLLAPYQKKVYLKKGNLTTEKWMSPLKIFEYMAAGKAIISSDLPVLHEILEDGYNCLYCPPNDVNAWIDALVKLDRNEEYRKNLGANAYTDIVNKYSWEIRAKNFIDKLSYL